MDSEQKRLLAKQRHAYYENYRELWKANGLCQHCGHVKEDARYKTCEKCRKRSREANEKYSEISGMPRRDYVRIFAKNRRDRLTSEGLCYVCGKAPVMPGTRWCEKCSADATRRRKELRNESAHQQTDRADAESN